MTARTKIVLTRPMSAPVVELLESVGTIWSPATDRQLTGPELIEAVAGSSAIISLVQDRVDHGVLASAGPSLRIVANVATGWDNVDLAACAANGVAVTHTPRVVTAASADLAFALILMTARRLGEGERLIRSDAEWWSPMASLLGSDLQEKTLGIVGLGRVGQAVAQRARAFGMQIAYTGRRRADASIESELAARFLPLADLLSVSDFVSLHCPLTAATRSLIDAEALATMKPTAIVINTSRGGVVDEAALARALRDGTIRGAGLDVYAREPDVCRELLALENVVLLPHLGTSTVETRTAMGVLAARNVVAVLEGREPPTPVPGTTARGKHSPRAWAS